MDDFLAKLQANLPREPEVYGDIYLSVQASEYNYCKPRVAGLPFDQYTHFEVAIISNNDERWLMPDHPIVSVPEAMRYWNSEYALGSYVPRAILDKIRASLSRIIDVESSVVHELPSSDGTAT